MNTTGKYIPKPEYIPQWEPPKNIIYVIIQALINLFKATWQLFCRKSIIYYATLMIITTLGLAILINNIGASVPVSIITVSVLVGCSVWFRYRIDGMI